MGVEVTRKLKKQIEIPIYGALVWIVVDKDILAARKKFNHLFGEYGSDNWDALCCYNGRGYFGLFFKPSSKCTREVIAHEIFHLTHHILEWCSIEWTPHHHEHGALLCGYLTEKVCGIIFGK